MSAPRLFGSQAKASISAAEPAKLANEDALVHLMAIRVGPHACKERLLYHLRINSGRLHWSVNSYFREACAADGRMDYEPGSMRECAVPGPLGAVASEHHRLGRPGDAEAPPPFDIAALPGSVLEKILLSCSAQAVAAMAASSRALAAAAASDQVWRALYLARWGEPQPHSVLAGDLQPDAARAGSSPAGGGRGRFQGAMQERFRKRLKFELEMRCLKCGNRKIIPLVFGFPSPKLVANQQRGRLVLGGDYLADGEPHREPCWTCSSCSIRYTRFPHAPCPEQLERELLQSAGTLPAPSGRLMH